MATSSTGNPFWKLKMLETTENNPYPLSLLLSRGAGLGKQKYMVKPTTSFKPYSDPYMDLSNDPYEEDTEGETNEYLLDTLVNKILTNQAVSLAEGNDYHEDFENTFYDEDKVPEMYKTRANNGFYYNDKALPKKKKENTKRGRKKKSTKAEENYHITSAYGEFPVGSEQFTRADGTQMITLTAHMMRQYMYTETDARVRYINDYYERQWDLVNRERMQALADLIKSQETSQKLKDELDELTTTLEVYKTKCVSLGQQLSVGKEAKKRRKQAKKQRKSDNPRDASGSNLTEETLLESELETLSVDDEKTEPGQLNADENGGTEKSDSKRIK